MVRQQYIHPNWLALYVISTTQHSVHSKYTVNSLASAFTNDLVLLLHQRAMKSCDNYALVVWLQIVLPSWPNVNGIPVLVLPPDAVADS